MPSPSHNAPLRPDGWDLARYHALVDNLPVGIFEAARTGEMLFCNAHLLRLLGLPDGSPPGPAARQTFTPADREKFWGRLEAEGELTAYEAGFRRIDGQPHLSTINRKTGALQWAKCHEAWCVGYKLKRLEDGINDERLQEETELITSS